MKRPPTLAPLAAPRGGWSVARGGPSRLTWLLVAVAAIASALASAADAPTIRVLTGRTSGAYYPLGVALGKTIAAALPSFRASAQATRTAAENLNLLQAGRGEIAFAPGDALSDAWRGNAGAGFRTPLRRLRGIAALYPNYIQVVARADAGIRSLADLRGKRISVGAEKSGIELDARNIFRAAGLAYDDFAKVEYLPFGESVELMKNRQIDATLQSAVLGVASMRDLAASVDIVVVAIPREIIRKIGDPAYLPASIPANTYRGQEADVASIAIENYLVTHDGLANDVAYATTKALWTNVDQLVAAQPAAKAMALARALDGLSIPLHPGAAQFYREVGILK